MTNKLKQIREKKGVPIAVLAKKAAVSRQTIYNIESNPNASVTSHVMEALAKALDVKASDIFLL